MLIHLLHCYPQLLLRQQVYSHRDELRKYPLSEPAEPEHHRRLAGAGRAGSASCAVAGAEVGECPAVGYCRCAPGSALFHRQWAEFDTQRQHH